MKKKMITLYWCVGAVTKKTLEQTSLKCPAGKSHELFAVVDVDVSQRFI